MSLSPQQPLADFVQHLLFDGQGLVVEWQPANEDDRAATAELLSSAEKMAAIEAPGNPPAWDPEAAVWSCEVLRWACYVFVERSQEDAALPTQLQISEPQGLTACHHWSVDLGFRFLASLWQRASRLAAEDELPKTLQLLAERWPLAAAGSGVLPSPQRLQPVMQDACLRAMLVDRIFYQRDQRFAEQPLIQPYITQAIGAYTSLKPW